MRMAGKLGAVCRDARLHAGLRLIDIATEAGVSQGTIHYFERGDWWARDTDTIVAAYARLTGAPTSEIWRRAVGGDDGEHDAQS